MKARLDAQVVSVTDGSALKTALMTKRVLVCVGSGGVGKTTVSATLALRAAAEGRSALVCTIDPARRLANSLGLAKLGNTEAAVPESQWTDAGLTPRAPLYAMMVDMKQSWDELITRYAAPDKREKIFQNRFYKALSTALAGSQEYIALEKLWQLRTQRDYQLIVLDTPPTAHALDFLDAPNRILDFLDNDAAKWLLTPAMAAGKVGLQLFNLGGSFIAKTLSRLTGAQTLQELASFMLAISSMNKEFRERAKAVRELLASDQTAFVLVTGTSAERQDEAIHFLELLRQNKMAVAALVVNRIHPAPSAESFAAARTLDGDLRQRVEETLNEAHLLAEQDAAGVEVLREKAGGAPILEVPRFDLDVHDLKGLWKTSEYLTGAAHVPLP